MSDSQSRQSARGRVSARGGRGGHSSRGGRVGRAGNTDSSELTSFDDSELGQMKKKYADALPTLRELFSDWKDEDLVFALEDSNGSLEDAIERITEGNVSQWGEVKKKTAADRDRARTKAKEAQSIPAESTTSSIRGGRGRGGFEGRGRARGDRGRGGRGGRAGAQANGTRTVSSTTDAWGAATESTPSKSEWPTEAASEPVTEDASESTEPKSSVIPEGTKKGWASLFAAPPAPPPQKKAPVAAPVPVPVEKPTEEPIEKPIELPVEVKEPEPVPEPVVQKTPVVTPAVPIPAVPIASTPKDDLTQTNLDQIPDMSAPAPTATAASTIGSVIDPAAVSTPSRVAQSGLPGSAYRQGTRVGGFRRVMEQQQAVVMPGNHAVDRAAVQFGSMGLNGDSVDIDENREEAETRAQPPQHSPVAPRAALPPSQVAAEAAGARPAPGLPPVPQPSANESFSDYSRYSEAQKPYDPFNPQASQLQAQIQEPFANQAPAQSVASTGSEYPPFYAADQQRFPYNYYGGYGQSQDAGAPRAAPGFGVSGAEAQPLPTGQAPSRYGPVDTTNSGHNTPNPTLPGATQTPATQHMQGQNAGYGYPYNPYYNNPQYASYMQQVNAAQQHSYGRNRPAYDDVRRYDEQQQQIQQQHQQQGQAQQGHYGMPQANQYGYGSQYGGPYGGKAGGMYGQPNTFSYDHTSSPGNAAASFTPGGRDSVYGRTSSTQPSDTQPSAAGATAFGSGMSDVFGRSQAGFGQNPPVTQQPPVTADETKGFEAPKTGGPSPSLAQANRPGSATNSGPGQPQAQTGLPPLQGQQGQQGQQGFGGYGHLNPQYGSGSLGGLSGHQGGASQTGYANYGAGFGNYYGNSGRGGWGNNYGH
ncbi:hypothetical protein N7495_008045 [Penicillium taxi]|uniref:uncharacterized protein n=1 Tax=Penicillium taxi TaxID=168475 RepID=UPI002544DBAC|nr:uncharacterized protein N7495_008045 [Penicillium taxi]KAJ5888004.1 hypothetical protein N7495_008045 [Penicillium taxi]